MSRLHETFASALRAAREACSWTQAELAERIGLSIEAYGRLERGRVLPRTATLVRLARALQIPLDELLGTRSANDALPGELRARAIAGRMREASPEDLQFLLVMLGEVQRWRREALEQLRRQP
jgi:transcriptional regulator with XRE-family HTH domain